MTLIAGVVAPTGIALASDGRVWSPEGEIQHEDAVKVWLHESIVLAYAGRSTLFDPSDLDNLLNQVRNVEDVSDETFLQALVSTPKTWRDLIAHYFQTNDDLPSDWAIFDFRLESYIETCIERGRRFALEYDEPSILEGAFGLNTDKAASRIWWGRFSEAGEGRLHEFCCIAKDKAFSTHSSNLLTIENTRGTVFFFGYDQDVMDRLNPWLSSVASSATFPEFQACIDVTRNALLEGIKMLSEYHQPPGGLLTVAGISPEGEIYQSSFQDGSEI